MNINNPKSIETYWNYYSTLGLLLLESQFTSFSTSLLFGDPQPLHHKTEEIKMDRQTRRQGRGRKSMWPGECWDLSAGSRVIGTGWHTDFFVNVPLLTEKMDFKKNKIKNTALVLVCALVLFILTSWKITSRMPNIRVVSSWLLLG